jgi:Rieske Fe-S protein
MPPQVGDRFAFASGSKKGQVVRIEDLELGGRQVLAYPIDPTSGTVRNGTRLNEVALVRCDQAAMDEQTKSNCADGVVAYSAVCTHQGCPVSMWKSSNDTLFCSCHSSQFDPRHAGAVVWGPAPRPLAMLPLDNDDGVIVVAGEFVGHVGFK